MAAAALAAMLAMTCAGTPGLGMMGPTPYTRHLAEGTGGTAERAVAWVQQELRWPLARRLLPLQRVFRIRQNWHLYRGGPRRVRHIEIHVDGELVHRTHDPDHAWRAAQLRYRRIRPMQHTLVGDDDAANWRGLTRWVVGQVLETRPDAQEVRISALWRGHQQAAARVVHGRVARAPGWEIERLPAPDGGE